MRRRVFVALCSITALGSSASAETSDISSGGIASGFTAADWRKWDAVRKHWYVWGFRAGQNSAAVTILELLPTQEREEAWTSASKRLGVSASIAQIVEGVDQTSKDYRNQGISLWLLVGHVIDSIGGNATDKDLEVLRHSNATK